MTAGQKALVAVGVAVAAVAVAGVTVAALQPTLSTRPVSNATPRTFDEDSFRIDRDVVSIIGDSFTSGAATSDLLWPQLIRDETDWQIGVYSTGGAGYVHENPTNPGENYLSHARSVNEDSDVVVIFGSINDRTDLAPVAARAAETIQAVKDRAPEADIVVVPPVSMWRQTPPILAENRDILAGVAAEQGVTFVDPIAEGWFAESNGSMIGSDSMHPNDDGVRVLAQHFRDIIAAAFERHAASAQPAA